MNNSLRNLSAALVTASASLAAFAAPAYWTDWTSSAPASVAGTLDVNGTAVGLVASGTYSFVQTSGGTNYWNPSGPYISAAIDNAPPAADIIALNAGGTETITFSQAVLDPLIALVSWNGNTVDFGVPIQIVDFGAGFWGNGTPILNAAGTGFFGSGEVHGVVKLIGSYTSISFTHTSENWHGFTVGVLGLGSGGGGDGGGNVPEPASLALFGIGLAALALVRRRKAP